MPCGNTNLQKKRCENKKGKRKKEHMQAKSWFLILNYCKFRLEIFPSTHAGLLKRSKIEEFQRQAALVGNFNKRSHKRSCV